MALMNRELVADFIRATMEPDSLRVLVHMMEERLDMLQAKRDVHIRPMIQGGDGEESGSTPTSGPDSARKTARITTAKASETKTPNKREKMSK